MPFVFCSHWVLPEILACNWHCFVLCDANCRIPIIGGKELDLHRLFVEVTSRGGLEKVSWEYVQIVDAFFQIEWLELLCWFERFIQRCSNLANFVLVKTFYVLMSHNSDCNQLKASVDSWLIWNWKVKIHYILVASRVMCFCFFFFISFYPVWHLQVLLISLYKIPKLIGSCYLHGLKWCDTSDILMTGSDGMQWLKDLI